MASLGPRHQPLLIPGGERPVEASDHLATTTHQPGPTHNQLSELLSTFRLSDDVGLGIYVLAWTFQRVSLSHIANIWETFL